MKTKTRRKANKPAPSEAPPEPAWRRNATPAKRRPKKRRHEASVPGLSGKLGRLARVRPPQVNWRVAWRYGLLIPVLAAVIFGGLHLQTSERFYVFAAEVRGNQRVKSDEIYTASQVEGQSVFWIRPATVDQRVRGLPGILSAHTHIRLPNRVIIEVQEQRPLVEWRMGGQTIWVSEDGQSMPAVGAPPPLSLTDAGAAAAEPGQAPPRLNGRLLTQLLAVREQRPDLTDLYYGLKEGLYFRAPEGWTVYLGKSGDMQAKLAQLDALRRQIKEEAKTPNVIDLRLDGTAFYQ